MSYAVMKSAEGMENQILEQIFSFAEDRFWLVMLFSLLATLCAYGGSVFIIRRKRGIQ